MEIVMAVALIALLGAIVGFGSRPPAGGEAQAGADTAVLR
jgi:hypothetical protein